MTSPHTQRLIIAISGAGGAIYGIRLLQKMQALLPHIERHVIVSTAAWLTIQQELNINRATVEALASELHTAKNIGATIASGSFLSAGMIIAPCSMKTLAAIAHGLSDNLITRAADVTLKERRRLVLMTRETPLHLVHLRNMLTVTEMGGIISPPVPAFYQQPQSLDDLVDHTVMRALDLFALAPNLSPAWAGLQSAPHLGLSKNIL